MTFILQDPRLPVMCAVHYLASGCFCLAVDRSGFLNERKISSVGSGCARIEYVRTDVFRQIVVCHGVVA